MDRHHIAHYAIAATLGIGGVSGYHYLSSRPPIISPHAWPALTDAEKAALTAELSPVVSGKTITVYCVNSNCADIAEDVVGALRTAGATARIETPLSAADGLQVGSDPAAAAIIGEALKAASVGTAKIAAPHHGETYISFGRHSD